MCQLQPGGVTTDRHPASWINGRPRHVPVTRAVIRTNTSGDCMALNTERNRERIEGLFGNRLSSSPPAGMCHRTRALVALWLFSQSCAQTPPPV